MKNHVPLQVRNKLKVHDIHLIEKKRKAKYDVQQFPESKIHMGRNFLTPESFKKRSQRGKGLIGHL